jgi:hypothetical protein
MSASVPRRSSIACVAAALAVVLAIGVVHADPVPEPDVRGAPVPGQESGRTDRGEPDAGPSTARVIGRGVRFVPRVLLEGLLLPIRGGVWVYDRYQLRERYYRIFYNRDRTFGIVPTIAYRTGFGLMGGARLISTDTFGDQEHLTIEAAYGGSYQALATAWLDSGNRFGRLLLIGGGDFYRFRRLPFYGIGNADLDAGMPMLIDPLTNDTAHKTYYRFQQLRAALGADLWLVDDLHLIARGSVAEMRYGPPKSGTPIDTVYDPAGLVGFERGIDHLYGELELRWDHRRTARLPWETTDYTTGWLVSGFGGGVHELRGGADFAHYGIDLQAFVHLGLGPRMLVFRILGEGVTGDLDEIPFNELPYLGGDLLRGYDFARFRDRVSALGTAQYEWDLSRYANAFLFVDAGRVYSSLEHLTFDDMRIGYGGGLVLHSETGFLLSGTIASSIDGGVFVTASLSPVWDLTPRWR